MNTREQIEELIEKAPSCKIAVIGDLIVDEYWKGKVDRISPEAPIPILERTDIVRTLGGAGNVYQNLKSMGANVSLFCDYPKDGPQLWGAKDAIFDNDYPCSTKIRMVSGNHQLFRVDVETPYDQIEWKQYNSISWWRELMEKFDWFDIIVISDYSKGVMSDGVINTILEFAQQTGKTIIVDAKRDLFRYASKQVIIKCNRQEWIASKGVALGNGIQGYVVTNGGDGLYMKHGKINEGFRAHSVDIVDVCGAGDTVAAILALGIGIGMYPFTAAKLANMAASEVCRHPGVVPVNPDWLMMAYERTQESVNP